MVLGSVELLPRSFEELTLHDVTSVVEELGEERENRFFERKDPVLTFAPCGTKSASERT